MRNMSGFYSETLVRQSNRENPDVVPRNKTLGNSLAIFAGFPTALMLRGCCRKRPKISN
jgi:hypothetical protein